MNWNLVDRSLCQIKGLTRIRERHYLAEGVTGLEALVKYLTLRGQDALLKHVLPSVRIFQAARRLGMADVIVNSFPVGTRSRVVADRYKKVLFFDVETNGWGPHAQVTLIATSMNGVERVFVRGIDLFDFLAVWNEAEVIVSFNGKRFDVPVLMHEFGMSRVPAHVDLMDEARHYGLRGGLKEIERRIGFQRVISDCKNGMDAIEMWKRYQQDGKQETLDVLKRYNLDDVRSLVALFRYLLPLSVEEIV